MRLDDIPLFSVLKGRLGYLDARQKVVAQNVANADTPGFTPNDLKPQSFDQALRTVALARTQAGHMAAPNGGANPEFKASRTPDSETKMNGNSVVLEEQMLKMAESRMAYDAAISFYQKSLNMLRLAARKPGG